MRGEGVRAGPCRLPCGHTLLCSVRAAGSPFWCDEEPEVDVVGTAGSNGSKPSHWDEVALPDENPATEPGRDWSLEESHADEGVDEGVLSGSHLVVGDNLHSWADCDVLETFRSLSMEQVGIEWCRTHGGHRHVALGKKDNVHKVGRPVRASGPVAPAPDPEAHVAAPSPGAAPIPSPDAAGPGAAGSGAASVKRPTRKVQVTSKLRISHRTFVVAFVVARPAPLDWLRGIPTVCLLCLLCCVVLCCAVLCTAQLLSGQSFP